MAFGTQKTPGSGPLFENTSMPLFNQPSTMPPSSQPAINPPATISPINPPPSFLSGGSFSSLSGLGQGIFGKSEVKEEEKSKVKETGRTPMFGESGRMARTEAMQDIEERKTQPTGVVFALSPDLEIVRANESGDALITQPLVKRNDEEFALVKDFHKQFTQMQQILKAWTAAESLRENDNSTEELIVSSCEEYIKIIEASAAFTKDSTFAASLNVTRSYIIKYRR